MISLKKKKTELSPKNCKPEKEKEQTYIYLNFPNLILVPSTQNFEFHSLEVRNYNTTKLKHRNN